MVNGPVRLLWDALYATASRLTGVVGLTPAQLVVGLAGLLVVGLVVQLLLALTGTRSWSLEDPGGAAVGPPRPPRRLDDASPQSRSGEPGEAGTAARQIDRHRSRSGKR